ncbi:MAG: T9SS type A sorting domain-containing protein [Candidatus Eisenbacteria bacterium]|uniref:T9SS type A sorting domain-containing protein n=1 Tax=Eiseniibacteriota bacterium TaxID=2212470 RepID=A0A956RPY8_UNCEI|nr:T9SS type A sorting domain-containing protein [Candidatus Eisenbacteria bacterium]
MTLAASLLLLGLGPVGSAHAQWSGTTADELVSFDDNEYARGVQVVGEYGRIYLFWAEDAPTVREIHFGRSSGHGQPWSCSTADRVISLPDGNAVYEEPDVATFLGHGDLTPNLYVVWSEDYLSTQEVHLGISYNGGDTFTSEVADILVSDPASEVDTGIPSIAHTDDAVHVVWHQVTNGVGEVFYSRSTDDGVTWSGTSGDRMISFPDGNGAITPKITEGPDGQLFVFWRENGDAGMPVIHVGISTDGGDTWSSETADREISQPVRLMTDLDASGSTVVYTASHDTASPFHYEAFVTTTYDGGLTFTGETIEVPVSFDEDHTRSASNPAVLEARCSNGGIPAIDTIVAWDEADDVTGTNEQHISQRYRDTQEWTGATADEIVSFPDGENGYRPSIALYSDIVSPPSVIPNTYAIIAWTEFAGDATDNYEVHVSQEVFCDGASAGVPESAPTMSGRLASWPNPVHDQVRFALESALSGDWTVDVFTTTGRRVRSLSSRAGETGGLTVDWNLADTEGRRVPNGMYLVRATGDAEVATTTVVVR